MDAFSEGLAGTENLFKLLTLSERVPKRHVARLHARAGKDQRHWKIACDLARETGPRENRKLRFGQDLAHNLAHQFPRVLLESLRADHDGLARSEMRGDLLGNETNELRWRDE